MSKKVRQIEKMIGQSTAKNLMISLKRNKQIPEFIILQGETGSGKTTMAEWFAMANTCTNTFLEPCLKCDACKDNLRGLNSNGISRNIKKVNMGKIDKKSDMTDLVKEIFSLQAMPGENIFYILEEIQELGEYQGLLLEELDRPQENVYVIACTTDPYKLRDTLLNRSLRITFNKLTSRECILLIDNLCKDLNISLPREDKMFLATSTKNNAREITNVLHIVKDMVDVRQVIRDLYSSIPINAYLDFLELSFKDFNNFILGLSVLEDNHNIMEFWRGFRDIFRDAIYFYYGGADTIFNPKEKDKIKEIFSQLGSIKVQRIFKITHNKCADSTEIELQLMLIREIVKSEEKVKLVYKSDNSDEKVNIPELKKEYDKEEEPKRGIKTLTLESLNNIEGNRKVYKAPKL